MSISKACFQLQNGQAFIELDGQICNDPVCCFFFEQPGDKIVARFEQLAECCPALGVRCAYVSLPMTPAERDLCSNRTPAIVMFTHGVGISRFHGPFDDRNFQSVLEDRAYVPQLNVLWKFPISPISGLVPTNTHVQNGSVYEQIDFTPQPDQAQSNKHKIDSNAAEASKGAKRGR